jgi:hypothetical protein
MSPALRDTNWWHLAGSSFLVSGSSLALAPIHRVHQSDRHVSVSEGVVKQVSQMGFLLCNKRGEQGFIMSKSTPIMKGFRTKAVPP